MHQPVIASQEPNPQDSRTPITWPAMALLSGGYHCSFPVVHATRLTAIALLEILGPSKPAPLTGCQIRAAAKVPRADLVGHKLRPSAAGERDFARYPFRYSKTRNCDDAQGRRFGLAHGHQIAGRLTQQPPNLREITNFQYLAFFTRRQINLFLTLFLQATVTPVPVNGTISPIGFDRGFRP